MARIPYFDPDSASDRVLAALVGKRRINVFRMIANAENCAPEVLALGGKLSRGSSLDPALREIVILRIAHVKNVPFMWHEHTVVATRVGFSPERIAAVAAHPRDDDGSTFSGFERHVLDFTDAVLETTTAPQDVFETVREGLDDSRLVELILLIGFYVMVAGVMNTFELEIQDGEAPPYRLRLE